MIPWDVISVAGALLVLLLIIGSHLIFKEDRESDDDRVEANTVRRSLSGRIVLCVDCDAKRILRTNSVGRLVCGVCDSECWQHVKPAILPPVSRAAQMEELERIYELPVTRARWIEGVKKRALAKVEKANHKHKGGAA